MGRHVLSTTFSGTKRIRAYAHCAKQSVSEFFISLIGILAHKHTHKHTDIHRHTKTQAHTQRVIDRDTHRDTHIHVYIYIYIYIYKDTNKRYS